MKDNKIEFDIKEYLDKQFQNVDKQFQNVDKQFQHVDKQFHSVDRQIRDLKEDVDKRLDNVDKRLDNLGEDVRECRREISVVKDNHLKHIQRWLYYFVVGVVGTLMLAVFKEEFLSLFR